MVGAWLSTFAHDDKVHGLLVLIFIDFVLGIIAAVKMGNFRFSYVSDFLRNDLLFKVVPYFALYACALVRGEDSIIFDGLTWGVVAGAAYVTVLAAMAGSLLASIADLGLGGGTSAKLTSRLRTALFGGENAAPPKD